MVGSFQHLKEIPDLKFDRQHFSFAVNVRIGSFFHRPTVDDDQVFVCYVKI